MREGKREREYVCVSLLLFTRSLTQLHFALSHPQTGISVRTNELFLIVFLTRYLDLFTTFYSLYNSLMKVLYIVSTASIIYTIKFQEPIKSTYDKSQDSFLYWQFAVAPCAVLASGVWK